MQRSVHSPDISLISPKHDTVTTKPKTHRVRDIYLNIVSLGKEKMLGANNPTPNLLTTISQLFLFFFRAYPQTWCSRKHQLAKGFSLHAVWTDQTAFPWQYQMTNNRKLHVIQYMTGCKYHSWVSNMGVKGVLLYTFFALHSTVERKHVLFVSFMSRRYHVQIKNAWYF